MSDNKLVQAYNRLLEHLNEIMDEGLHTLTEAIDKAKQRLTDHDLSEEQLQQLEKAVHRDLGHAASAKQDDPAHDWSEWLKFDIDLLENFAWDAFLSVADKTQLELTKLKQRAGVENRYFSGEITAPGTYVCASCGKEIAFKSPSQIPPCPTCGADSFMRK
ncbi:MAG: zinc ribbon-containing protein [Methylococcales bacterium]|nr:zinc ribbon-containing protein [Methylococcales bacterium]